MHPTSQWRAYRACPDAQASSQVQGNGSLSLYVCLCVCVCSVTWFSCSEPIAWPWSQRRVVYAWMRVNVNVPLCKIIFVPPPQKKIGGGGGGDFGEWDHPAIFARTHSQTPTKAQVWVHTPPQWFNLMMGIGGETGICEGQKSLNSNIHHCRLLPLFLLLHCHYCWPASSHYQLTSSNTLHYQLVLNRQMGWTLQQMTE